MQRLIGQTGGQSVGAQHHRGMLAWYCHFYPELGQARAHLFGERRIALVAYLSAALLGVFAQSLDQPIVRVYRRCEWGIALILQARETRKVKVLGAAHGALEGAAPHDDKGSSRHAM